MNVTGETLEERQNGMHLKDFSYKSNNMKLMETPVADKGKNPRISTPPESVMLSSRKISVFNTPTFKGNDVKEVSQKNQKTALLSPAFSSPQPKSLDADYPPPKPTFVPLSSFSSDDDHQSKTKKRGKKSRKAAKERSFNFDSNDKPPYSYATLIGMSILSNSEKKLTLSQIYSWISDTFKYYKRDEVGWQNSIRHNLSLNKAFIKGEKSKDGKGHFWCIKSGCEEQFLKSRANKNSSYQDLMDQIYSSVKSTKRSMNSIPSSPTMNSDHQDDDGADSRQQKKRKVSESISYDEEDDDDSNDENYHSRSSDERGSDSPELTANDSLNSLPELDPPFSHSNKSLTKHSENSNGPPLFIISDSPDKPLLAGKNLTYTSSFSCSTNLELSPIQPTDNGPLLEPLTPVNNIYNAPQNNSHSRSILSTHLSFPPLNSLQNHFHHSITNTSTSAHHFPQKTPKSGVIRTPLKIIKTPQTNSLMKKFWNSPSYLDEFYYSPLTGSSATILNSYDDDDMILRNMEHHQQSPNSIAKSHQVFHTSRNLIHDFKKVETRDSDSSKENKSPSTEIDE